MRKLAGNLALSLISLVVFFGAGELVVRLAKPDLSLPQSEQHFRFTQDFEFELPHHTRDARLGWRLTPGTYGAMRINSHGFRGREFAARSQGKRVAHLGDSCTMGFTIAADRDVYSARLEAFLQRRGMAFETLNFGVDGYSSHQGRALLDLVLATYEPAYVTLYFGYNDHHFSTVSDRETNYAAAPWRRTLEKSHAYRWMRRQLLRRTQRDAALVEPKRRVGLEDFENNLRSMVRTARAAGAVPILITTALRPGPPLFHNEVQALVDGEQRWVTQDWWLNRELQKHGLTLAKARGSSQLGAILQEGLRRYPQWPYLHYLWAVELAARGDSTSAREQFAQTQRLDGERQTMHEYNERVRRVARQEDGVLLDLAVQLGKQQALFNDVVHPNARGHALIADALAQAITQLELGASGGR